MEQEQVKRKRRSKKQVKILIKNRMARESRKTVGGNVCS